MRLFFALFAMLSLLAADRAEACSSCKREVSVAVSIFPSTTPAIPLIGALPASATATLYGPDGGVVPSSLGIDTLIPGVPLEPNTHYEVRFTGLRCVEEGKATDTFETTGASPLPAAALGTVSVSEQTVGPTYASNWCNLCSMNPFDGCSCGAVSVHAAQRVLSLAVDAETIPFGPVVSSELVVDDGVHFGHLGLTDGAVQYLMFSRCNRDDSRMVDFGLEPGEHSATLSVKLTGGTSRTSAPFTFTLGCDGVCVKPSVTCGLPDQLCDDVPDAGIDRADAGLGGPAPSGCSTEPLSVLIGLAALLISRKKS